MLSVPPTISRIAHFQVRPNSRYNTSTTSKMAANAKASNKKQPSHENIVGGFQELRQQQRAVASKISELEMERKEHELVIETLKDVDPDRKCFRMVGGVLVERTVKEVQPALINNREQLGKVVETLTKQLENKGKELNEYREKYGIKVRGEDKEEEQKKGDSKSQGVLVAKDSS